jgi:hypothetical protein
MPGYKYPNIDSGATPIGSTDRAPDRKTILRKNSTKRDEEEDLSKEEMKKKKKFEPMIDHKYPTIASGDTPIGRANCAPDKKFGQPRYMK